MLNQDTIFIVDDNPADIILAKKAITCFRPGCTVEHAGNGREALDILQKGALPALIFLDYNMPGINGIEVLQQVRALKEGRYVPIVILSSSMLASDIRKAYDAGANGFLHKTFAWEKFSATLQTSLNFWLDINKVPGYVS
jgi:CheY-like chemotaxis protein